MAKMPMAHQIEASEFLAKHRRCALWLLPRMGKTLSTLLALEKLESKRILIICPKTVQRVWADEFIERGFIAQICTGTVARKTEIMGYSPIVICTYESAWRLKAASRKWDSIVFDESIKLSNHMSKQTEHWFGLPKETNVFLLSGAPCPENYLQIASQMIICRGIWFGHTDIWGYLQEYWWFDKDKHKWKCDFPGHLTEVARRIGIVGLRKNREDIGLSDKKFYGYLTIAADAAQIKAAALINADANMDPIHKAMYIQRIGSGWDQDATQISTAKIDAIAEWIKEKTEVEPGFRCVVMCRFKAEVEAIASAIGATHIDGSIIGEERDKRIKGFQAGKYSHIVCQVVVAKMGVDFSMARTILYASNSWSGDDRIQSQERCTNLKLNDPVQIVDVCVEGPGFGIDYAIAGAIRNKKDFNVSLLRN